MTGELVGPIPDGVDPDAYDRHRRRVLWSFPTGLYLIGSIADSGTESGSERRVNLMTANLVVQVATAPKLVAAAVESGAVTAGLVSGGRVFSVSVLLREDRAVVRRFVKPVADVERDGEGRPVRMAGEPVYLAPSGAPVLARAAAWVDCALVNELDLGSHRLFIGEVTAVGGLEGDATPEMLRMEDTRMNYGG
jgi:flavin reductase (DIM6/NTAB) family NADH-FMN oxidoreductase RutF